MGSVRTALRQIFTAMGAMKVESAVDGDDALQHMAATPYEIILCDYSLGDGRDGMQVLEEAKQRHLIGLGTVFIMITGEASLAMVLGVVEHRPDEYLIKPITRQMLEDRLAPLVVRKGVLMEIERAIRDKDLSKALRLTDEKLQSHPNYRLDLLRTRSELLLRLGQFDAAGEAFEAAGRIRETFWVKLGRGQVRYYLGDYTSAAQIFQAIINENKMNTEAYDWMARVHQATGNYQAAKETLSVAAQISPRSILRAQMLGEISVRTGDPATAEQALRNAVRLGRFSVYGSPNDNARLSKVFMERGNPKEATRIIKEARRQYSGNSNATLTLAIAEAVTYQELGLKDIAQRAMNEAATLYQAGNTHLPPDLAMSFAKVCHASGNEQLAITIMSDTVNSHVADTDLMEKARETYNKMNMSEAGEKLITAIWTKVAATNNEGVRLVREGRINEAIGLLEKAAREMPKNPTLNMNAARVLLLAMEKTGRRPDLLARAKEYLDRIPISQVMHDDKFQRLRGAWVKLAAQLQQSPIPSTTQQS